MIWTPPQPRIVIPPTVRPAFPYRRPFTRHRPDCPLRAMAGSGLKRLDSAGRKILDSSGRRCFNCDCSPPTYCHARKCADGSYADGWVLLSPPWPRYFHLPSDPSTIYYVDSTCETTTTTPATVYTGLVADTSCGLCAGCSLGGAAKYLLAISGMPTTYHDGTYSAQYNPSTGLYDPADLNGSYEVTVPASLCNGSVGIGYWVDNPSGPAFGFGEGVLAGLALSSSSPGGNGVEVFTAADSYVLFNGDMTTTVCNSPFTLSDSAPSSGAAVYVGGSGSCDVSPAA